MGHRTNPAQVFPAAHVARFCSSDTPNFAGKFAAGKLADARDAPDVGLGLCGRGPGAGSGGCQGPAPRRSECASRWSSDD